jgi:hypothetical protein
MTAEQWDRVQALFETASELHGEERTTFLQNQCANDDEIYREVTSLLDADENIHMLLEGLAIDAVVFSYEQHYIGRRIGPYRIKKHVGSGGMSYVFLAEREDGQFDQRVALKIIKTGNGVGSYNQTLPKRTPDPLAPRSSQHCASARRGYHGRGRTVLYDGLCRWHSN